MTRKALLFVLAAAALPGPAEGGEPAATDPTDAYYAAGSLEDPRLHETTAGERRLQRGGDAAFERPFHIARFLAGVVALPVVLPIAWVFTDWNNAVDVCVTGPYAMAFERPLGD